MKGFQNPASREVPISPTASIPEADSSQDRFWSSQSVGFILLFTVILTVLIAFYEKVPWKAATYPSRGWVTINGEAPAGVVVELRSIGAPPDVRNSRPWGIVQEDGSYDLTTYQSGDGAPAGHYAVTLRWPKDISIPSSVDRLNGAYAEPARSPWKLVISKKKNHLTPIVINEVEVLEK